MSVPAATPGFTQFSVTVPVLPQVGHVSVFAGMVTYPLAIIELPWKLTALVEHSETIPSSSMTPQISPAQPATPTSEAPPDPAKLDRGWRLLMAVVGTAMLAAGALAALRTKQEVGSTALIIIGAIILSWRDAAS